MLRFKGIKAFVVMFKISPSFNQTIKIFAIVLLFLEIVKTLAAVSGASPEKSGLIVIYVAAELLFVLTVVYISAVLRFFHEKKMISTAYIVFAVADLLVFAGSLSFSYLHLSHAVVFASLIVLIALLASAYIFIMSLFIREKVVFGPVLMFTISMLALELWSISAELMVPIINDLAPEPLIGHALMRGVVNSGTIITVLLPIAIMRLTDRVTRFINTQQDLDVTLPG